MEINKDKEALLEHSNLLKRFDLAGNDFIYKYSVGSRKKGTIAGSIKEDGYSTIIIDRVSYYAHRLKIFYLTGMWPISIIDHKNRNKLDNSIENLLNSTHRENASNRKDSVAVTGVYKVPSGRYSARIYYKGKLYYLGTYDNIDSANIAYSKALLDVKIDRAPHNYNKTVHSKGYSFDRGKWLVQLSVRGNKTYWGRFTTEIRAQEVVTIIRDALLVDPLVPIENIRELINES